MPLKSKAQLKKFGEMVKQGKMTPEELNKWIKDTPNIHKLPEKVGAPKLTGLDKLKHVAKTKIIK